MDLKGGIRRRVDDIERNITYDMKKVNWRDFDLALQRALQSLDTETSTAQEHAEKVTELIQNLMQDHFPKLKKGLKKVYW